MIQKSIKCQLHNNKGEILISGSDDGGGGHENGQLSLKSENIKRSFERKGIM
jgi:hypothetical protein